MISPTLPLQNCDSPESSEVEFAPKREDNPAAPVPGPIKQPNNFETDRFVTCPAVFDAWPKLQRNDRSGPSSSGCSSLTGRPAWMRVVTLAPHEHWKIFAGDMLLCLGSSSRFGDSIRLASLSVISHNGLQILEAESMQYNTAHADRKNRLLPLIGLGRFFTKVPWASDWMDLRKAHNLGLDPALPAWSEISNSWLDRRMTTGEAHWFLRDFRASSGFKEDELDLVGCHSLNCTLLSWDSKGGYLPISDRLLMGHHLTRESQSAVVYGREELTRIAVVAYQMVRDIKNKKFRPDASRAERVAMQVGLMAPVGEQDNHESSDEDDALLEDVEATESLDCNRASGMTSSLMSFKDSEFMFFRGCSYQVVPR